MVQLGVAEFMGQAEFKAQLVGAAKAKGRKDCCAPWSVSRMTSIVAVCRPSRPPAHVRGKEALRVSALRNAMIERRKNIVCVCVFKMCQNVS